MPRGPINSASPLAPKTPILNTFEKIWKPTRTFCSVKTKPFNLNSSHHSDQYGSTYGSHLICSTCSSSAVMKSLLVLIEFSGHLWPMRLVSYVVISTRWSGRLRPFKGGRGVQPVVTVARVGTRATSQLPRDASNSPAAEVGDPAGSGTAQG
jgi:hypothetical protein